MRRVAIVKKIISKAESGAVISDLVSSCKSQPSVAAYLQAKGFSKIVATERRAVIAQILNKALREKIESLRV